MTADDFVSAGIPLNQNDAVAALRAEAALEWIAEHTTITFDKMDADSIKSIPACAKLFIVKFCETMRIKAGVTSQSIEGLSQSFDATESTSTLIWSLANSLLQGYLKSQVRVFPAKRRW